MQEDWPLLIIVPASLRLVWAEELERWLPHLRPSTIHVIENSATKIPRNSCPQVIAVHGLHAAGCHLQDCTCSLPLPTGPSADDEHALRSYHSTSR